MKAAASRTVKESLATKKERLSRIEAVQQDLQALTPVPKGQAFQALVTQLNHDAILALALPPSDKLQAAWYAEALSDLASLTVAVQAGDPGQVASLLKAASMIITKDWRPAGW